VAKSHPYPQKIIAISSKNKNIQQVPSNSKITKQPTVTQIPLQYSNNNFHLPTKKKIISQLS
jgi:hypothetical protein